MTYRPYPNAERALNNLRRQQAVYMYGRVPQRYVMGFDMTHDVRFPVDGHRRSTRPRAVGARP